MVEGGGEQAQHRLGSLKAVLAPEQMMLASLVPI